MRDLRNWPQADAILDEALQRGAEERDAFIREAAGQDGELLDALRAVLAEVDRGDDFLKPASALSSELFLDADGADRLPPPALAPGDRVGVYDVLGSIGHGGMGEVYRARDTQLGRDVALKVPRLGGRRDLVARLERESRLLAALNHPNIAGIYGLTESNGIPALVLELVEGTTLAERLRRGPLRVPDAVDVLTQIASALQAAHERGIVHRDLKPANVKIAPDGRVKVLDFGLAKALADDDESPEGEHTDLTAAARRIGLVFGTAAYMSPEQARSAPVDRRTDLWALGCVLFEALTGRRAFDGRTTTEVLARVLERDPDLDTLPPETPPALRRLIRRCLQKDPSRRLADARDAILELEDARVELTSEAPARSARAGRSAWWRGPAAALVMGAIGLAVGIPLWRAVETPPSDPTWLTLGVPAGDEFVTGFQPLAAISPDGRTVVYRARRDGTTRLFKRTLGSLDAEPIPGTEEATGPFFSPDGRWLAFDGDGVLKKVLLSGGAATAIAPAPGGATGAWTSGDQIVFATNTSRVLRVVPAAGGEPRDLTALDVRAGDVQHAFPDALPDGRTVLFTIVRTATRHIAAVSLEDGFVRLLTNGTQPRVLDSGHLVFARENAIWAAPLDLRRGALAGEAVPIARAVEGSETSSVHFGASRSGTLVYLPDRPSPNLRRLAWSDRQGRLTLLPLDPKEFRSVRVSPDGQHAAIAASDDDNSDVWVVQLERGVMTRLTFEPTVDSAPIWSRDGRHVMFRSERGGGGIFRRAVQGTGEVERLTAGGGPIQTPASFAPDGRTLLFTEFRGFREQSIARVALDVKSKPERLLDGRFAQLRPELSPDGRWLAYQSDETGRFEIYVRPYPDVQAGKWQVSQGGGTTPRWRGDGRELFFHDGTGIAAVAVTPAASASGTIRFGTPVRLFDSPAGLSRLGAEFDVSAAGTRFLVIVDGPQPAGPPSPRDLVLVQHWVARSFNPL